MATDRYDIVIFGASGFTGQFVVEEVARIADEERGLTWAIAGRAMGKMQKVLEQASKKTGKELDSIPVLIADTTSESSMVEMCKQAKVILNCVGPYRFHGEMMVKAAIEGGASHLDISGEPQFLENMQLKYHNRAKESGVYIIGACGFDSIPAEMGVVFVNKQFTGEVNSVESYLEIMAGPEGLALNTGTLESAVHGVAHVGEIKTLRRSLFPERLPPSKHKLLKRGPVFTSEVVGKYCVDFLGSDKSVVYRSQRYKHDVRKQRPIQFIPYLVRNGIASVIGTIFFGLMFFIMCSFRLGQNLLMKYPSFFTAGFFKKGGPTKSQIEDGSFKMTFVAKGWSKKLEDPLADPEEKPDTVLTAKIAGPEIGYVTTPICMVQAALVVLKEADKLPQDGGVYPPGAAFMDTTLIERLNNHNVTFTEVKA
ncbi:saccharopine dehydrogenase-like oxidoreductase isoform X1 [Mizuhopecten yessoensis]|uniref:saccharopine dehydrogenase-like oxidoreductase isoform X1 n=1 Tax=Mizuhopecten yessoensis TaxID=6573 RepID=UPI000B4588F4|nr:saccharopine dehydrogenase-like oxidoreductase isoform X1 [Mizuhopecten yessoensis]